VHPCDVIPRVRGSSAVVGPPLDRAASRRYLAGHFPHVPQNMVEWSRFPQELKPPTGMPDLSVSGRDARAIAAFLYRLR
jgi:hypothetical protein